MAARVVRFDAEVILAGFDHHNGFYYYNLFTGLGPIPGPPIPHPPGLLPSLDSWHFVMADATWDVDDKSADSVRADGDCILTKDHAAKHVVHIPPGGNVLIAVTIYFATATWKFAVHSVLAEKRPVASTLRDHTGFTVDCGDPISLPSALYTSPGTVHITPTAADFGAFAMEMAKTGLAELAASAAVGWGLGKAKNAVVRALWGKEVVGEAVENAARRGAETGVRETSDSIKNKLIREQGTKAGADAAEEVIEKQRQVAAEQAAARARKLLADDGSTKTADQAAREAAESSTRSWTKPLSKPQDNYGSPAKPSALEEASVQSREAAQRALKEELKKAAEKKAAEKALPLLPIDGSGDYWKKQIMDQASGPGDSSSKSP
jgi:hypothetical protein